MRYILIYVLYSYFLSCNISDNSRDNGNIVCYHFTENTPHVDTIILLKKPKQYNEVSMKIREYWNDTIILNGIKMPPQIRNFKYRAANNFWHDTLHVTFDKYKATKVELYHKYELY